MIAARAGSPSHRLLVGLSDAGSISAERNPTIRISATNTNGILSLPMSLSPRTAPRIMIAVRAIGTAIAAIQGADLDAPFVTNASAYASAIAAIETNRTTTAARLGFVIATPTGQTSPASARPCNHPRHGACWRRDACRRLRAQSHVDGRSSATFARWTASTRLDSGSVHPDARSCRHYDR